MSPEQFRGEAADARSNIFLAGVMLFEMLGCQETVRRPNGRGCVPRHHVRAAARAGRIPGSRSRRQCHPASTRRETDSGSCADGCRNGRASSAGTGRARVRNPHRSTRHYQVHGAPVPHVARRSGDRISRPEPARRDFPSLAAPQSVVVRSAAAAAQYAGGSPDWTRIANDAHVDHVLVGTIMRAGAAIRVSTQLLTTPDGTVAWSDTWQGSLKDVFQLQDDIVNHIVESLSLQLTPRDQRTRHRDVPASASAYELYFARKPDPRAGPSRRPGFGDGPGSLSTMPGQGDPNFAPAWARLGRCYWLLSKGSDEPQLVSRAQNARTGARG